MNGLTNVNDDLILGDGSNSRISFRYYSNEAGYIKGGSYGVEIGCASSTDPVKIQNKLILSGSLLMSGEYIDCGDIYCDDISCDDIECDDITCDAISCYKLTRNNDLTTYGVKTAPSTIDFYTNGGTHIGGINFSSGATWS